MRFSELRSIAHSLASGYSELIGVYQLDVFGEAASTPQGYIEVDFLAGTASGGRVSEALGEAAGRFRAALPDLCRKHCVSETAFRRLRARYFGGALSVTFVVTVEYIRAHCDRHVCRSPGSTSEIFRQAWPCPDLATVGTAHRALTTLHAFMVEGPGGSAPW